jgi:hypothetical protein
MAAKGKKRAQCAAYRNRNQREHNKVRKIKRHLKRYPADLQSTEALKRLR